MENTTQKEIKPKNMVISAKVLNTCENYALGEDVNLYVKDGLHFNKMLPVSRRYNITGPKCFIGNFTKNQIEKQVSDKSIEINIFVFDEPVKN